MILVVFLSLIGCATPCGVDAEVEGSFDSGGGFRLVVLDEMPVVATVFGEWDSELLGVGEGILEGFVDCETSALTVVQMSGPVDESELVVSGLLSGVLSEQAGEWKVAVLRPEDGYPDTFRTSEEGEWAF